MKARIGELTIANDASGTPIYSIEVRHDGFTNAQKTITKAYKDIAIADAEYFAKEWDKEWSVICKRDAIEKTEKARKALEDLRIILNHRKSHKLKWGSNSDSEPFKEPKPTPVSLPVEPTAPHIPREPQASDVIYQPQLGLLTQFNGALRERLYAEKRAEFDAHHREWKLLADKITGLHSQALRAYEKELHQLQQRHEADTAAWERRKADHYAKQLAAKVEAEEQEAEYESHDPAMVRGYCERLLELSEYPDGFPKKWEVEYNKQSRMLIVDYALPSPDDLPTLKAVKFLVGIGELEEQHVSTVQAAKTYDDVLYQVVLRVVYELFEHDAAHALDAVVINGIVTAIDRRTGKPVTACVLSLRVTRSEFIEIDLSAVDPKACFKALRGVGSSKLHGLAPVPPIMPLNREDDRFVPAYGVANTLDDGVNLAAMNWEDFEHLIREIFEQEFAGTGGDVKVTQASRDGGVDAVAFDPDPIRGGKIIIQAKRYTNTVGVSAVRDLYGTVLNEGATKGVLVTTSDYGPDSYAFARGKPLVLLNGANLLHMLERHGHKARIDLMEARRLASGK